MTADPIPRELRRYLLSGTVTVPHVEAILQLRADPGISWDAASLAARLYVRHEAAADLLRDLHASGIAQVAGTPAVPTYRYGPAAPALETLLEQLQVAYTLHLGDVARLIHSVEGKKAHAFADAFRFRKEP